MDVESRAIFIDTVDIYNASGIDEDDGFLSRAGEVLNGEGCSRACFDFKNVARFVGDFFAVEYYDIAFNHVTLGCVYGSRS